MGLIAWQKKESGEDRCWLVNQAVNAGLDSGAPTWTAGITEHLIKSYRIIELQLKGVVMPQSR